MMAEKSMGSTDKGGHTTVSDFSVFVLGVVGVNYTRQGG